MSSRPVFVIGTGRSGTHWLGYSLGNHPEIRATIEEQPMFGLSTRMALDPSLERQLFERLVLTYQWQLRQSTPRLYVDKTHPNIWLAELLKRSFPDALFLGIERNPYATVASMLRHQGVSSWHRRWREFPIPNRFLGISEELADGYDDIPLASQCALRWLAHHERMNELRTVFGGNLFVVQYEHFAVQTESVVRELQDFLGLRSSIPIPDVKSESLAKWKEQLSDSEIQQIHRVVGFPPEESV